MGTRGLGSRRRIHPLRRRQGDADCQAAAFRSGVPPPGARFTGNTVVGDEAASMLYLPYPLDALTMIALPVVVGVLLAQKLGAKWGLFGVGALTFIASQVVHIPLNAGLTALFARGVLPAPPAEWKLLFNATVLGTTAGLSEEIARYAAYRWFIKSARTWRQALMFGAGHGGAEAIILGGLVAATFVTTLSLRGRD